MVTVAPEHTQWHTQSIGLLWTRERPFVETYDNTQHSKEADIQAPGEIRTRNPSKQAAARPMT
jgi:hypothetical protein